MIAYFVLIITILSIIIITISCIHSIYSICNSQQESVVKASTNSDNNDVIGKIQKKELSYAEDTLHYIDEQLGYIINDFVNSEQTGKKSTIQ